MSSALAPTYPIHRIELGNGLRVVLAPDRGVPVVAVAVYYDVGMRSEPEGRTGFAHLFEHLMFQGSENVEKMAHARHVQSSGGSMNGSTRADYTNYYETLPSNALERALFLEADRMRSPRITEENLVNQISVVKEEIRVNVLNQPYGGFPWLSMPPLIFDTFPNAHNGYGDFVDLDSATVADAAAFFDRYYAPGNAVLCLGGDFEVAAATDLVSTYFGPVAARRTPPRQDSAEPDLTAERRSALVDPLAPVPAVALAWRVPDPVADLAAYLPFVVAAEVLSDGETSRLEQRLVRRDRLALQQGSYLGLFGNPFDCRDPSTLTMQVFHPPQVGVDTVLTAVEEELERLATDGLAEGELRRVNARLAAQLLREADSVLGRTLQLAGYELVHRRAELLGELPNLLAGVTAGQVCAAAATLRPDRRAVLELVAGGAG
ncbi:pitrilysin family protein [soil metagenome]